MAEVCQGGISSLCVVVVLIKIVPEIGPWVELLVVLVFFQ